MTRQPAAALAWVAEPTIIGKRRSKAKALSADSGSARLVKLLLNPKGHLELTPAVICEQTGLRPKDLSETMRLAAVKGGP